MQPSGSVRRSRKGEDTGHVPLTSPANHFKKAFALTPSLSNPLSLPSSHPGTPRSSPADFLPIARRGDRLDWRKDEDSVIPNRESTSLPQPSSKHPPKSCPWSRIPGATELCRAGTGRIQSQLPPPWQKRNTHAPAPSGGGDPRAAGQLTVRDGAERTPSAFPPPPTRVPAPRSPAVSHRAKLGV